MRRLVLVAAAAFLYGRRQGYETGRVKGHFETVSLLLRRGGTV
jgi:hypothetical protein